MAKAPQKMKGAIKEVAAEILGDQNLQDEGKRDRRDASESNGEEPVVPAERLHNLIQEQRRSCAGQREKF